jgi:hypothetical protein
MLCAFASCVVAYVNGARARVFYRLWTVPARNLHELDQYKHGRQRVCQGSVRVAEASRIDQKLV